MCGRFCSSPQGGLSQSGMPWGAHLAGEIGSCQPVIFCAKLGLGPQMAAQQLGCWESSPRTWLCSPQPSAGPAPQAGCLADGSLNFLLVAERKHLDSLSWAAVG